MATSIDQLTLGNSDEQIAKLFEQARDDFERETHQKLSFLQRFDTVDEFVEQIRKERSTFGSFREHEHPNLFRHISNALKPVQTLAKIFAGPSGNAAFASGVVLNAISFLIDAADGVSLTYNTLELLFEKIENVSAELEILSRHALPSQLRDKVVELFIAVIRICSLSRKLANQGRFLEYAKGLKGKDPAVSEQLEVFDRLHAGLSSRVQSLAYDNILGTKQETTTIKTTLQQQSQKEEAFREEVRAKFDGDKAMKLDEIKSQQAEKIREVLQPTVRNRVIHNSFKSTRAKQSGGWVIGNRLFQSWAQRSFPVLWLSGGPGIGKSSLTSFVIEFLRQQAFEPISGSPRITVVYFYFKEADRELRSFANALRTMASDIADSDPRFFRHLYKLCNDSPKSVNSTSLLWEYAFQSYFSQRSCDSAVYLIFDGLDEAIDTELEDFLRMLAILQHEGTSRLSVLLVGRPEIALPLTQTFGEIPPEVRVSAVTNNSDIGLFVNESLPKLPHYKQISQNLRNDIRHTLINRAGGMFLWVQLILKELQPYYKSKNIRPILTQAPASISDMIHSILLRFNQTLKGDDLYDFNELLVWTTWAKRPMSIGELEILVKLGSEEDDDIFLEQPLREQFSSFFGITSSSHGDESDGQINAESQSAKVMKVKLSLREESDSDDDDFQISDSDDSSLGDTDAETSTSKVNFNHTSIRQYFQAGINTKVGATGISALDSKVHLVRVLLRSIVEWKQWSGFDAETGSSTSRTELDTHSPTDTKENDQGRQAGKSENEQNRSIASSDNDDDDLNKRTLISYAANNWHLHLAALDPTKLRLEDKSAIAPLLVRLFHDRSIIWIWVEDVEDFSNKWLETRENIELVYKWLEHFLALGLLSGEENEWVKGLASGSVQDVLAIVMDEFARNWLENENSTWSGYTVFQWLVMYTKVVDAVNSSKPNTEVKPVPIGETPADTVRRIARRYRSVETSMWHARIAWVMRKLSQPVEAVKEVNLAIEMKPNDWFLLMVKAKILASQRKWQEAIKVMTQSNKVLEDNLNQKEQYAADYWANKLYLAQWFRSLGENAKSLENYRSCLEQNPNKYELLQPMLRMPIEEDDYRSAMNFLREQRDAKMPRSETSRLVHAILAIRDESFHIDIFETARQTQELKMAQAVYKDALSIATSKKRPGRIAWIQHFQAVLLERYLGQRDDAVRLWEAIMRDSSNALKGTALYEARDHTIREMCNVYIDQTIHLGKGSPVAKQYLQKVRDIGTVDTSLLWHYDTATALGVLYTLMGEDEQAKKCFRSRVKISFDLLTDKDPGNDYAAYFILCQEVLVHAGPENVKDCLAAYSLLGIHDKTPVKGRDKESSFHEEPSDMVPIGSELRSEKSETQSHDSEIQPAEVESTPKAIEARAKPAEAVVDTSVELRQPPRRPTLPTFLPSETTVFATTANLSDWIFACCDGCDKDLNIPDDSYICTLCLDMNFCPDCQVKLKNNVLGFRICSPQHELLYVPEAPGPLPKDMIRYGDEYVPILDWLMRLRKTWGI